MMIINSYIYDTTSNVAVDLDGLDIVRHWSLFKTSLSTFDVPIKIRNGNGTTGAGSYYWVFFDDNGEISLDSLTQVSSAAAGNASSISPGTDTLQDLVDVATYTDWFIYDYFDTVTGARINKSGSGLGNLIIESDVICTDPDNGKPAVRHKGVTGFNTDGLQGLGESSFAELDAGEDQAVCVVASGDVSGSFGYIVCTDDALPGFFIAIDRRPSVSKRAGFLYNDSITLFKSDMNSNDDTADVRMLTVVVDTKILTYKNGTAQTENPTLSGTYTNYNDFFKFRKLGATSIFSGHSQFLATFNNNINSTQNTDLYNAINNYLTA